MTLRADVLIRGFGTDRLGEGELDTKKLQTKGKRLTAI